MLINSRFALFWYIAIYKDAIYKVIFWMEITKILFYIFELPYIVQKIKIRLDLSLWSQYSPESVHSLDNGIKYQRLYNPREALLASGFIFNRRLSAWHQWQVTETGKIKLKNMSHYHKPKKKTPKMINMTARMMSVTSDSFAIVGQFYLLFNNNFCFDTLIYFQIIVLYNNSI